MRLFARTALAITFPALHCGLIDAECKFNEHAFINTEIERARECNADLVFNALIEVKDELQQEYQPLYTQRKPV